MLVLPNHHAVVLAKRIATVDVLSGGRVRMCVGVGWMDEELRATGADPRSRGRRTDETIAAMRTLWADSGPSGADFDGEFFSFRHAHSFPKPVRPGGVPIHIGGHSEAAARRAGRLGDGFQPLGLAPEDLAVRMDQMRAAAEEAGRDPAAIELSLSGYLPTTSEQDVEDAESAGAAPPGRLHVDERRPGPDPRRDVGVRRAVRPSDGRATEAVAEPARDRSPPISPDGRADRRSAPDLSTDYAAAVDDRDGERLRRSVRGRRASWWSRSTPTDLEPVITRSGPRGAPAGARRPQASTTGPSTS